MRPEHEPDADPCKQCGLPADQHRKRFRSRAEYYRAYRLKNPVPGKVPREKKPERVARTVLGLDGEGYTTQSGRHRYTYLAASDSTGTLVFDVENPKGLSTEEILDFLISLPPHTLNVGFALGYDFTKWLENLPDRTIYELFRPDLRPGRHGPRSLRVAHRGKLYGLNLIATKLIVSRDWNREAKRFKHTAVVWDLFRFFQRAFVASLKEWGVGTEAELAAIQAMKDARGNFTEIGEAEKTYCKNECRLLAALCERLIEACEEAQIPLKDYYGAGSLGAATLRNGPAKKEKVRIPKRMREAVACAFFGGRFEHSARGPIGDSHGFDLASAYPYAETQLPCLRHGKWKKVKGSHAHVEKAVRRAKAACVRYMLTPRTDVPSRSFWEECGPEALVAMPEVSENVRVSDVPRGPFTFRLYDGTILFPVESSGGWVWKSEILAALDHPAVWPNVLLKEAWVLEGSCNCPPPFLAEIGEFYRRRLEWGKEAKGLVLKKGLASRYGKRAQTVGAAPFHCGVAAGMITAHTRSEILRAIGQFRDGWDVLSVATDGIITRTAVTLRLPLPTGTDGSKPLGMWEHKDSGPVFLVRPGMRFLLDEKGQPRVEKDKSGVESLEGSTAARGVGVKRLHAERGQIVQAWKAGTEAPCSVPRGTIFNGAKTSITGAAGIVKGKLKYTRLPKRNSRYGRWTSADAFKVSYLPLPKRAAATPDHRFLTWALSKDEGTSAPYDPIQERADLVETRAAEDLADEQPDWTDGIGD